MELPAYLADEAILRLLRDQSPAKLTRLLALLDLDLIEPGPEPDYEALASKMPIEVSENEHRGSVSVAGELSLLGHRVPVHLRYSYVGELDDTGFFGSISQLELLVWPTDARVPRWSKIDIGIFSRPMMAEIDALVLAQVLEIRTLS